MSDLISIITPVYNASKTINQCIQSVLKQSYSNWELVVIDDGSSDNSLKICKEYAFKDKRINIYSKDNSGTSRTRNYGIEKAHGEWITFLDADDRITEDYLNVITTYRNPEIIVCGLKRFGSSNIMEKPSKSGCYVIDSDLQKIWNKVDNSFVYFYIAGKIYRRDIIEKYHIRFDTNLFYSEDFCFFLEYISYIKKIQVLNNVGYLYYTDGISRDDKYQMNFDQFRTHYTKHDQLLKQLERRTGKLIAVRQSVMRRITGKFLYYLRSSKVKANIKNDVLKFSKWEYTTEALKYVYKDWKGSIKIFLYKYFPQILLLVHKF